MKHLRSLLLLLICCQCSTTPEKEKTVFLPPSESTYQSNPSSGNRYNDINLNDLFHELNMSHPLEKLGYQEKSFNTCQIQSNKSQRPLCKKMYVSRLNFHVMCRDSTGTVEKVTLEPLSQKMLRWKGGPKRGRTSTDSRGYGSLGFVSKYPSSNGHLYFYLGSKIARKRFKDNWKLILPKSWCDHH